MITLSSEKAAKTGSPAWPPRLPHSLHLDLRGALNTDLIAATILHTGRRPAHP